MRSRAEALHQLTSHTFDVCVIGAGATGAGCALDAQLRGFATALVDAGDFGSATSSASTKLVHGGVRYLQEAVAHADIGQFRVVKHALRERVLMLKNAPHLAHPLEFIVPCFSSFDLAYYGVGMKIYEWIASGASLGRSRILSKPVTLAELPGLKSNSLRGSVSYWDGQFDDARFCIALTKTFADAGGEAANYLRVVDLEKNGDGKLVAAVVEDCFSADRLIIRAHRFINATGPFSDHLRTLANPATSRRLAPSKGVHILLPLSDGVARALLIPKTEDGRVIFAIPWLGRLLVGTTDQEVDALDELRVTQEEVEYLLRHLNHYSSRKYQREDVVSVFAGIRPLVRSGHAETKELARDHVVEVDHRSGLISILGGKWTTYRYMAEQTIDALQKELISAAGGQAPVPTKTRDYLLTGGRGYTPGYWQTLVRENALDENCARHLAEKFGSEAIPVLELTKQHPELRLPIADGAPPIRAEVIYCSRTEMASTIEDVLARRIGLQFYGLKMAMAAAPVVGSLLAKEQGWSWQQETDAVKDYTEKLTRMQEAIGYPAIASRT
jgi:glycerol-3-phosphate dehydrogenase